MAGFDKGGKYVEEYISRVFAGVLFLLLIGASQFILIAAALLSPIVYLLGIIFYPIMSTGAVSDALASELYLIWYFFIVHMILWFAFKKILRIDFSVEIIIIMALSALILYHINERSSGGFLNFEIELLIAKDYIFALTFFITVRIVIYLTVVVVFKKKNKLS
jgi:hypothetical protein